MNLLLIYRYYDENEMCNHIDNIQYMGMTTNTPEALVVRCLYLLGSQIK